ncbi:hypothetical protein [Gordonia neofelifaecis]|uniref:Uncharacterized protein n=1 Tax=Gordonia neofelifaecis NRRL B-59395 TaxID=644548 RepID=F1YDW3_9ACTN|nr:hypothetical protein [Gordonia neofelifaecis]EGD57053.1 hypothetical protein SCNU_01715 [Gordonia neofelifaecis NRRL B-59395]
MSFINRTAIAGTVAAAAALAGVVTAGLVTAAPAGADTEFPTVGDGVRYEFYSDVQNNEGAYWYDADNDLEERSRVSLPARTEDRTGWYGVVSFTSRSKYQLTGATIQTDGYFAACRVYVNGTLDSSDSARGRYAMATC